MANGKKKEKELTPEEKLQKALVPVDEQPYEVPENWQYYRISGLVTHLKRGKAPKYVDKSDIPVFAQKCNQKDGTIAMEKAQFLNPEIASRIKEEEFLKDEDVLINSTGTGTLGRVGYYRSDFSLPYQKVLPDSHITVIRGIDVVSQNFLYYYLKSKQDYLEQQGVGTTNQKELRPEAIGNIVMPLPPLPEQQRIVDRIESLFAKLDEAKEKAQAVVDGFEDRKAAILHKAFTGELTEGWRKENNIESKWIPVLLKDCSNAIGDGLHGTPTYDERGSYYFVNGNNLNDTYIKIKADTKKVNHSEYEKHKIDLSPEYTVFVSINGTIGKTAFYNGEAIILGKSACYITVNERLNKFFLRYYLNSKEFIDYANEMSTGSTIKNLGLKAIRNMRLLIPNVYEQCEIVRILDEVVESEQHARGTAEQVINQIDTMKKSILARAFRGELGTNDPSEESAIVNFQ